MAKEKKSPRSRICFYPDCRRPVAKDLLVKHCRDHAGERVAAIQDELRALRDAYGDDAKPAKVA